MPRAGETPRLKRGLGLGLLTLYGLGTTIGAGIYVLIGSMAGVAGVYAPVSFLVAALLVVFTGLSFAELGSRHPHAAGEAVYVRVAFGREDLALAVGLVTAFAGIVSAAAIINGATGYVQELVPLPRAAVLLAIAGGLALVAAWGIVESSLMIALITLLETAGLIAVILAGALGTPDLFARLPELVPPPSVEAWGAILASALLAFFAFVGFEAMVNLAEEVKDVARTLPRAILLTLVITSLLYGAIACVAVLAVDPAELAASSAPLALVFERASGLSSAPFSAVAAIATVNGALVMMIMATRVVYGLAQQGNLPAPLGRVNARTRTPLVATALVAVVVAFIALALPLATLARASSALMLAIFMLMNLTLLALKRRGPPPAGALDLPRWIPASGLLASGGFLAQQLWTRVF